MISTRKKQQILNQEELLLKAGNYTLEQMSLISHITYHNIVNNI